MPKFSVWIVIGSGPALAALSRLCHTVGELNPLAQVPLKFCFTRGCKSFFEPAQSSADRLHANTLTGKLSTNRSRASSLSRSRPGRQRSRRTTSKGVPFGQSVLWQSAFSKLGSRSMPLTTMRCTLRGLPLPAPERSSNRNIRRFSVARMPG